MIRWSAVLFAIACTGADPDEPATLMDHEGVTVTLRSGFTDQVETKRGSQSLVVLSNMDDACASLAWWSLREEALLKLFLADPFDEGGFLEAIANTQAVWTEQMSTARPWYTVVLLPEPEMGVEQAIAGATRSSRKDDAVFWANAYTVPAPEYDATTTTGGNSSRSFGPDGYEAASSGGEVTVTVDEEGARGRLDTRFETDALDQFEVDVPFDVPLCTEWSEALGF